MKRSSCGWALACIVIVTGIWFRSQNFAEAAPPISIATAAVAPVAVTTDRYGDTRISYPPNHYPQMRLRNGEARAIHSILNVVHPLAFGDYVWNASGIAPGQVWVRVDLRRQVLSVFRGGNEIGTAVIIYGAKSHPTPVGVFHILQKSQDYYSKAYDAAMPFAQRLTDDGVAMHASNVRDRYATHGCIGLPLEFARLLFGVTSRGDEVEILPDTGA